MGANPPFPFPNPYGPPGTPADARKQIHFQTDGVQPPSFVYVDVNSSLFVGVWSTDTNPAIEVQWKILTAKGEIILNDQVFKITAAPRIKQQFSVNLTEGFLLGVQVFVTQGAGQQAARGQTRAVLQLLSGSFASGILVQTLAMGMIDAHTPLGWPGLTYEPTATGPGFIRTILGTTPAAGAEVLETVPTNARWRLVSFRNTLTTSATVANRGSTLAVDNGSSILFAIEAPSVQPASLVQTYNYGNIGARSDKVYGTNVALPFPSMMLGPGYRIGTVTTALQAGDQYSQPVYNVEEFLSQ